MQKKLTAYRRTNESGVTLIELLVVIAIIALVSSILIESIISSREKARDATRLATLDQIAKGIAAYNLQYGDFMNAPGTDCGQNGQGFFNQQYGGSARSMAQCIIDAGFSDAELIDISGERYVAPPGPGSDVDIHAFMKFDCPDGRVMIFANLETIPKSSTAVDSACTPALRGLDSIYGMDHIRVIE